jgi:hypothetical protein
MEPFKQIVADYARVDETVVVIRQQKDTSTTQEEPEE